MVDAEGVVRYMKDSSLAAAIVCGFSFKDSGLMVETNNYILSFAGENKSIIPFVGVDVEDEDQAIAEVQRCIDLGACGVGEIALYGKKFGRRQWNKLNNIARHAEENNLAFMLHMNEQVGHAYEGKIRIDFKEAIAFIESHQNLNIILSHLGGGICFYEFMPEVKRALKHVYYDIAAIPFLFSREIYRFIEEFLSEKTLFGSDYPLLSFEKYSEGLMGMNKRKRDNILSTNAKKILGNGRLGQEI
jgi:predicted TIM-barrel fold metal-dependent hydrolase